MKLSAIIIAKNEEATIARALKSVDFAGEQIVVDSGSTDRTVAIARDLGAHVIEQPWLGYGRQKNVGREAARGEWLLFVDADEEVTVELRDAIQQALSAPAVEFYWLRIVTVFLGRPLRHLYGHNPRLFKRTSGRWTDAAVHEQVETVDDAQIRLGDDTSRVITEPLMHYSHPTVASYLKKMHHYTDLDAEEMVKTGRHRSGRAVAPTRWLPWRLALKQLVKLLIYRRGLLDGWAGIMWCLLSARYEWEMATKYINLHRSQ